MPYISLSLMLLAVVVSFFSFCVHADTPLELKQDLSQDNIRINIKNIVMTSTVADDMAQEELHRLSTLARLERSKYPEAISIEELNDIAAYLTGVVRGKGNVFDTIFLPAQRIREKTVSFTYQKAILSRINVINHTGLKSKTISEPFDDLLNKPLYAKDLEKRVYALQAQSEISVFSFYSRDRNPENIVLNIRVNKRKTHLYALRAENFGSETTGKNQFIAELKGRSVFSDFDRVSLAFLNTQGEGASNYGSIQYRYLLSNMKTNMSFSAGNSRYLLGDSLESLKINGESRTAHLSLNHQFNYASKLNHGVSLSMYKKQSDLHSDISRSLDRKESSDAMAISYHAQHAYRASRLTVGYGLTAVNGRFVSTIISDSEQKDFNKMEYHAFIRKKFLYTWGDVEPNLSLRGQRSNKQALPGVESVNLGGYYGVRSVDVSAVSADAADIMSFELHFQPHFLKSNKENGKHKWQLTPYMFIDAANGSKYQQNGDRQSTKVSGQGLGLNLRWWRLAANLTYAKPNNDTHSHVVSDEKILFQLRWQ